ncbi:MAG: S9 family peptidase [bacterium]
MSDPRQPPLPRIAFAIAFIALGAIAAVRGGGGVALAADAPGIAEFMKIKAPTLPALARDGTLYFRHNVSGVNQLFQCRAGVSQRDAKALTSFPDGMSSYALSPDGAWIIVTAAVGGDENAQLYLVNAANGDVTPLTANRAVRHGGVVWRRDSKAFAYYANDKDPAAFHVYLHDLAVRQSRGIVAADGQNYPADFSSDGARLVVGNSITSIAARLFEIDLASLASREITPAGAERIFNTVGYGPGDREFLVISDFGDERQRMQRIDLASGAVSPLVSGPALHDVDSAALNEDRSLVAILSNVDGYRSLEIRALPANTVVAGPNLAEGLVSSVSFAGRQLVFMLDNARTPGIVHTWSLDAPAAPPVARTEAALYGVDVSRFTLPQLVKYPSFDGLEIPAFLYLPPGYRAGEPIPFLIQFHGGPEEQFRPGFNRNIQYFVSRGFGVIAPNVRGSTGYGSAYLQMDDYKGRMGSVRDGIAAAEWLIARGYATKGRIGVYGASYGGFMVMALITEAPDLWGAACAQVGIVNFVSFLEKTEDYRRALRETEYGPLSDPEFLKSISPIYKADRITAPLMLVHGLNDPRVPIGEPLQVAVALKRRGVDVEQLYFPDEGHSIAKESNRLLFYENLARFFESRLAR